MAQNKKKIISSWLKCAYAKIYRIYWTDR